MILLTFLFYKSGTDQAQALNDIQANSAEAENNTIRSRFNFRGVDNSTNAGGDAATDVTDFVKWRIEPDFSERNFRQHGVVGKG